MNKKYLWFLGIVNFLLLTACTATSSIPTSTPAAPTATPVVLGDCFWSATAVAWLDANGNGLREDTEQPLAGIEFVLEPSVYSRATSDVDGMARIMATTPNTGGTSCNDLFAEMPPQVVAAGFSGYELTTAQSLDYLSADDPYEFGFQPIAAATVPDATPTATTTAPPTEPAPILIETEAYEGVIFTAAATTEFAIWFDVAAGEVWMPTPAQIALLEEGLAAYLQENAYRGTGDPDDPPLWERLPDYKRQYLGIEKEGEQLIYANYFCNEFGSAWQEEPVIVMDGGDCYFQVTYNADTNEFVSVYINGEA